MDSHSLPSSFSEPTPSLSSFWSTTAATSEEDVNGGFRRRLRRWYAENAPMAWSEENYYCFYFVVIVWLYVSTTSMMLGTGPRNVWFGHCSSILVEPQPNPLFTKSLTVKDIDESRSGLQLFGFYESPPLDVIVNWSESRLVSVSPKSYKEWPYYLNEGSSLNITYSVKPEGRPVRLVVREGSASSDRLLGESVDSSSISWNLVRGSGMVEVKINESSNYYLAVANSKMKDVKVELHFNVSAVLYDTKQAFYKCNFSNSELECTYNLMFRGGNYVVLTSPAPRQGDSDEEDEWYIHLSFQPRWSLYMIGTVLVICFMVVAIQLWKRFWFRRGERLNSQGIQTSLLANKDDDGSSSASSNESFATNDEANLEEFVGEASNGTRGLCAICIDTPRDCFFLPCGHCLSCYQCGTKVAEASGSCPVCRKIIKKVNRIYIA